MEITGARKVMAKNGCKNMKKKKKTESWRDRIIRKIANLRFEI
jgi:hypothetical protein